MNRHLKSPAFWLLLAITALYTLFSLTSRYDAPVGMDEVWDVKNASELVQQGRMPRHGDVSGLFALTPPGVSFAYVPGILLGNGNPATAERIGAACLFFGTLLGLYFWLEGRLGQWSAALAMALFAAGSAGAFFATSLWPRAHPFFYVWLLYFLTLWVERRDARYLAASLVVYAAGMYWFMEFAPAIFVLPVLYLCYRPPLHWRPILAGIAAACLIWSPYLSFEATRGFADLRCILTQTPMPGLPPASSVLYDKGNHLVDATYAKNLAEGRNTTEVAADSNAADCDRWFVTPEWGTVWFQAQERWFLGEPGYVFYSDTLGGWAFQSVTTGRLLLPGQKEWDGKAHAVAFPTLRKPATLNGLWRHELQGRSLAFAPLQGFVSTGFGLYAWHLAFFAAALVWAADRAWKSRRAAPPTHETSKGTGGAVWSVLLIGATVPAIALCLMMRNDTLFDGERRFWWLWVAYAGLIGAAAGSFRIHSFRIAVPLGILAVATLGINPRTQELLKGAFSRNSAYRGDAESALEALAAVIRKDGHSEAFIGYDMNLFGWQTDSRLVDGWAKSFAELDQALLLRHGIRNLDRSAEGICPEDQYILRSTDYGYVSAKNAIGAKRWSMTTDGSLPPTEIVAKSGEYEIRRVVTTSSSR